LQRRGHGFVRIQKALFSAEDAGNSWETLMLTIRRVLVAIKDPSAHSLAAVEKATQLALACGAKLELFHSITTHVYTGLDLQPDQVEELKNIRLVQYRARLEAISEIAREAGVTTSTSVEWDYPAHEAIVRQALKSKADLIVAECHAGRRLAPLLLHVTDWELLRYSPVPVLLVKSKEPYRKPTVLAAVDPTHANSKPTALDDEILTAALVVKNALAGSLHAVHSFVPIPDDVKPAELLSEAATRLLETRARAHASARLAKALRRVRISRVHRHLMSRHPVNAIPEVARKIHSDIVVMGAVSRTGLKRLLIGNTAERIIDDLSCDVLVVKPRDFSTSVYRKGRGMRVSSPALPMPY
jgi:universal stress protein E